MDKKWPDWTDFIKKGHVEHREHPLSKSFKKGEPNKGGNEVTQEELIKEALDIVKGAHTDKRVRQATDEELFGHLVVSEEELEKSEIEWKEKIQKWYEEARKPIQQKPDDLKAWANGRSFNDSLTEEELDERNRYVKE